VVLFIDSDEIGSISPLVNVFAGDYRVSRAHETVGRVLGPSGALVTRSFFVAEDDVVDGFTLQEFVAEIERALPRALADPTLKLDEVEPMKPTNPAVQTGSQIPQAVPVQGEVSPPSSPTALPSEDTTQPPKYENK
jgi:hypothetical protein